MLFSLFSSYIHHAQIHVHTHTHTHIHTHANQRSVYQLSPNEWVAQESLSVAIQDFLSHYLSGTLAASGE